MEPLQLLERYYAAFIDQQDAKAFFLGMVDYLDYLDGVPECDLLTSRISETFKPLSERHDKQHEAAMKAVEAAHKKISSYISKKKVQNETIARALQEYADFKEERAIAASTPLAFSLFLRLQDALMALYAIPEHKDFALQFVVVSPTNNTIVRQYLPIQEMTDFQETRDELERGAEDALWGVQMHIYDLRNFIKQGREKHRKIVERMKNKEQQAYLDVLNHGVVMGEWVKIEEGRPEPRPTFFNPPKIRPKVQRFHMYMLGHFADARKSLEPKGQAKPKLKFDEDSCRLHVAGETLCIRRVSDQFDLLRVIFAKPHELPQEWFFDDISAKVDRVRPAERVKKYYNAANQIRRNLATRGIPAFFITTTHTLRVNKAYLS